MKLPMFSDLQAHPWTWPGMEATCIQAIRDFGKLCKKIGASHALFGGDTFEAIGRVPVITLHAVYAAVAELQKKLELVWLLGNHGRGDQGMKHHADYVFSDLPNVRLVAEPMVMRFSEDRALRLTCIPYTGSHETFLRCLKIAAKLDRRKGDRNILFMHDGVVGAVVGPDEGYMPDDAIDPGGHLFDSFDLVLSGHYHRHQVVEAGGSRVVYIGAPMQHKLGDRGDDRGFLVLDTKTLDWERHFTNYPVFEKVEVETQADVDALLEKDFSNKYLRVVRKSISLDTSVLADLPALEVDVVNDVPLAYEDRLKVSADAPVSALVEEYVRIAGPKGDEDAARAHRERLVRLGLDIFGRSGVDL